MENNDNGSGLYSEEVRFDFRRMQWCLLGATPSAVTMHLYNDPTENSLGKPGVGIEKGAGLVAHKVSRLDLDERFGNRKLDTLILADGPSEHFALACIR